MGYNFRNGSHNMIRVGLSSGQSRTVAVQMVGSKADNPTSYECSIKAISNLSGPGTNVCATVQTECSHAIQHPLFARRTK